MTITIRMDEPATTLLQQEAAGLGITPEELAAEIVQRHLRSRGSADHPAADPEAFRSALTASVTENEELLRRLAR